MMRALKFQGALMSLVPVPVILAQLTLGAQMVRTSVTPVTATETVPDPEITGDTSNDLSVSIFMENRRYLPNQRVDGMIKVYNTSSDALPAKFNVKLYHNQQLFRHLKVDAESIPPGVTTYSLPEFGIPDLNKNRNYSGEWVIMIYEHDPAESVETSFRIDSVGV